MQNKYQTNGWYNNNYCLAGPILQSPVPTWLRSLGSLEGQGRGAMTAEAEQFIDFGSDCGDGSHEKGQQSAEGLDSGQKFGPLDYGNLYPARPRLPVGQRACG